MIKNDRCTRLKKEKNATITSAHLFMKKIDQAHTKTKENTTTIETDRGTRLNLEKMQRADRNRLQIWAMTLVTITPFHMFCSRSCGGEHSYYMHSLSCFLRG